MGKDEMSERLIMRLAVVVFVHLALGLTCFCLVLTGAATPFLESFSVDSEGRVYIAENKSIIVYDGGEKVGEIKTNAKKSWHFTITEDDEILCCTPSTVWRMDLEGNELERKSDTGSPMYSKLQFVFRDDDKYGNTYKKMSYLGRTRIVKNDTEIVYQISVLSVFTKILIYCVSVSFPVCVIKIVIDFSPAFQRQRGNLSSKETHQ